MILKIFSPKIFAKNDVFTQNTDNIFNKNADFFVKNWEL
jgi:hypothetical protein